MIRLRPAWTVSACLLLGACSEGGVVDAGDGVLADTRSGLEWMQRDNGSDIEWSAAKEYCASQVGGWRLPTEVELALLYDSSGTENTPCGSFDGQALTCNVSSLFRLTGPTPWAEMDASSRAMIVGLSPSRKGAGPIDGTEGARALCVRKGK